MIANRGGRGFQGQTGDSDVVVDQALCSNFSQIAGTPTSKGTQDFPSIETVEEEVISALSLHVTEQTEW